MDLHNPMSQSNSSQEICFIAKDKFALNTYIRTVLWFSSYFSLNQSAQVNKA